MKYLIFFLTLAAGAQTVTIGPAVFSGSGLDDGTSGGTYTPAAANARYVVTISATGTPDQFTWTKNGGSASSPVAITGSAQALVDGVTITFAATTGHTLADSWSIDATASGSASTSKFIQRGVGAVSRNTEDKLRDTISILDHGFVPGLHPNATVAFQKAADAARAQGKALYLPGQPYKYNICSASFNEETGALRLYGDGIDATEIETPPGCAVPHADQLTFTGISVEIDGVGFDGGDAADAPHSILAINNAPHVRLHNVRLANPQFDGAAITDSDDVRTSALRVENFPFFGVAIACSGLPAGTGASPTYNYGFTDVGSTYNGADVAAIVDGSIGLGFTGFCSGISVAGSSFKNSSLDLVKMQDARADITGVTLDGVHGKAIFLEGVTNANIQATITNPKGIGIHCQGSVLRFAPGENIPLPCANVNIHNVHITGVSSDAAIKVIGASFQGVISAATNASPVVFTAQDLTGNHYTPSSGQQIFVSGLTGGCWSTANNAVGSSYTVTRLSATTFSVPFDSTGCGALSGSPLWVIPGSQISVTDPHIVGQKSGADIGAQVITGATNTNPVVITAASAPSSGKQIRLTGMTTTWTGLNNVWVATNLSPTTFSVELDATALGALSASSPTWNIPDAFSGIVIGAVNGVTISGGGVDNVQTSGITLAQVNGCSITGVRIHNVGQALTNNYYGIDLGASVTNCDIGGNPIANDPGLPTMRFGIFDETENAGIASNTTTWGNQILGAGFAFIPTGIPAVGTFRAGSRRQSFATTSGAATGWTCGTTGTAGTCASGAWYVDGYLDPDARYVQGAAAVMTGNGSTQAAKFTNAGSGDQVYYLATDGSINYGKLYRRNGTNTLQIDGFDHIAVKPNALGGSGGRFTVDGNQVITGLAGGGSRTVCADNSGNLVGSGCPGASAITALTGDVTASGPGSAASTTNGASTTDTFLTGCSVSGIGTSTATGCTNAGCTTTASFVTAVTSVTLSCPTGSATFTRGLHQ